LVNREGLAQLTGMPLSKKNDNERLRKKLRERLWK
jgi:hypothetical protein